MIMTGTGGKEAEAHVGCLHAVIIMALNCLAINVGADNHCLDNNDGVVGAGLRGGGGGMGDARGHRPLKTTT
jgi:hypothetical protein